MSDHDVPSTCRIEESWSGAPQPWRRATATTSNEVRPSSAITSSYEPPSFEWGAPRSFDLGAIEQPWEWRGLGPIEQPWEWPIEPLDDCEETCQIHDGRNAGSQGIDELLKPEVAAILRSPNFAGTEHPGSKTAEISSNVRLGDWLRFVLIRSHASGQCHTPNTQASVRSGSTCGASGGRGTKHGRNTGSDEDDVGGDKRRKGKAKSTRFEENTRGDSVNELACPFPKRKPLDHTRCWMFSFVNTARLK